MDGRRHAHEQPHLEDDRADPRDPGAAVRVLTEGAWAHRDPADLENADFVAGNPQEVVMPGVRRGSPAGNRTYRQELLRLQVVSDPGDEVIFLSPPWFFYEALIVASGATPVRVKLEPPTFDLNVDGIAAAITERTRAVIVNSPHNPTGRVYAPEELRRLAEVLSEASARNGRDIFLVSDEAYSRIVFDDRDDIAFTEQLAERKVFVLPGTVVELPGTFRISLTGNDEMVERALPIFAEVAKG
jgi:aspartate/methionine/tyrosine aminotransferase